MSRQVDISKLLGRGYSTHASHIQECLCRRCFWAARSLDGGTAMQALETQAERDRYAYTGRIACIVNNPNHSRIRDCYEFYPADDSLPRMGDTADNDGGTER